MLEHACVYISPDHGTQQGPTFRQQQSYLTRYVRTYYNVYPCWVFSSLDQLIK